MPSDDERDQENLGSGVEPPVAPEVRQRFALLEQYAPGEGARWATELWCTPPVVEMSLRMPPGVPPSEPIEATWEGHRVVGSSWGAGEPVYLVHGWGGCQAHLGTFVKPLVEAGYRVIAFDLPSHNDSEAGDLAPGRTTLIECAKAVQAVVDAFGPAHAIVGHSLGAKASAFAVAWGTPAQRLVFLAPMGDFPVYIDMFTARHGFGPRIRAGLHRRLEQRIQMALPDTDIVVIAPRAENPPLLIIHDPDDPDTPYATSEDIVAKWPNATLHTTKGLGRLAHYRLLRHRPAITAAVEFITS